MKEVVYEPGREIYLLIMTIEIFIFKENYLNTYRARKFVSIFLS